MGGNFGQKKVPANLRLDRDNFGQNCPSGIRTRAYKKIATYNVHPFGVHIWVPFRAPIIMHTLRVCIWAPFRVPIGAGNEPKASGRATKRKENKSRPIMGTPKGCPYGLGALPSPLMHPLRGCIWGQGPKGPPCPHYRATEGGPLKKKIM